MVYRWKDSLRHRLIPKFANRMSSDTLVPSKATQFMQFSFLHWNMDHAGDNTTLALVTCIVARNFLAIDLSE